MIELYELRQFAAFADTGALSGAAEILHLSQPALSRNMKKLEDELGIILFERKKNKLELNENGEYVLKLAKELLESTDSFAAKARDFDSCPLISNIFPHMTIQTEMDDNRRVLTDLENNVYKKYTKVPHNWTNIPISDDKATVTYYLVRKTEKKKSFSLLFAALTLVKSCSPFSAAK